MTAKSPSINRRNFLNKFTSVVGGSAVIAVAPFVQAAPIVVPKKQETVELKEKKGYQRTQHVDTYYQLADF